MGKMSRDKGARFERQIADYFTQEGYECHRSAQYCGKTGDAPDVVGLPYIHIECKSYKDTEWDDKWMEQAKRDARYRHIPIVIHKIDRHKPKVTLTAWDLAQMILVGAFDDYNTLVTLDLDSFTMIYREYEAARYLEEGK